MLLNFILYWYYFRKVPVKTIIVIIIDIGFIVTFSLPTLTFLTDHYYH